MNVNKYRESVIQLYSNTLTKYFEYNLKNRIKNPYNGWKVILQILSMLYLIKMNVEQMSVYLERSYILFNEYSEKISSKEFSEIHSPSVFVQKMLIGNIALNAYASENKILHNDEQYIYTHKLAKWSEIIFHWGNIHIKIEDRQKLHTTFTTDLLNVVLDENKFHVYRIIEILQCSMDHKIYARRHSFLLHSVLLYLKKNTHVITPDNIQHISFNAFFRNKTELETRFIDSNTQSQMNNFVDWLFDQSII